MASPGGRRDRTRETGPRRQGKGIGVKPAPRRRFRKRVWLPIASLVLLGLALLVAVVRSRDSTVVVYNETDAALPALVIRAGGVARVFPGLAEEESVRLRLHEEGPAGPVELELAKEPPWTWRGGYLEPRAGYRLSIRLYPDGVVEFDSQVSLWQRLLHGTRPAVPTAPAE